MGNQFRVWALPDDRAAGNLAPAHQANELTHVELPRSMELTAESTYHPSGGHVNLRQN